MAKTITIPDGMEKLGDSIEALVRDVALSTGIARLGRLPTYRDVEERFAARAAEIERESHRAMLQALDVDAPRVTIEGVLHRRVLREESTYHTLAGDVAVTRSLYRECGTRCGKTVDPVSLHAGVVGDGWLPHTAQAMAHLLQQGTSREAETTARRMMRLPYSRSSFERVGHLTGELYVTRHAEVEDELIRAFAVPDEAHSVSVSIDRVSIPMEEPRKRPVGRPRKDAPKNPIERNFRMAWAGTVTFCDRQGAALHTIRYGRMPHSNPEELVGGLLGDVMISLEQRPALEVMALADGAHEIWNLFDDTMAAHLPGQKVHKLVDLWHLLEKLGCAARVLFGKDAVGDALARWRRMLLSGKNAASRILDELKRSGKEDVRVGDSRPVHEAITYLANHRERMDYASARRAGLPVGSGNVEATCKSLFEVRMKRPGSRWKNHTGSHIVQLRALALSDRWDHAMHLVLDPLKKSVRPATEIAS
jgi:hypothetical protein